MKLIILMTFFLLSSPLLSAGDVQGRFEIEGEKKDLVEGDFFHFRLMIWPLSYTINSGIVNSIKKDYYLSFFKVVKIVETKKSENNSDVLVIRGSAILYKVFEKRDFYLWSYKDINIPVEIKVGELKENKSDTKKMIFFETPGDEFDNDNWRLYLAIFISVLILVVFLLRYIKRKKMKLKKEEELESERSAWAEKFTNASTREDYENIYKTRHLWIKQVGGRETPLMADFYETINKHQFKERIDDDDLDEISVSFNQIREIWN